MDEYGRPVNSMRLSVTGECNQNCFYCHREGHDGMVRSMTLQELEVVLEAAGRVGVKRVKLTGGEPLVRPDIVDIVCISARYMEEVSMTTNGTLLEPVAGELRRSGLRRVNVSLDTVDREHYHAVTGTYLMDDALRGIEAAVKEGLSPVKVNIVALEDSSMEKVLDAVEAVWSMGAVPQVIEPVGAGLGKSSLMHAVEDELSSLSSGSRERSLHRRRIYDIPWMGVVRQVEVVRPMHNTAFCANCTRIRVTGDGYIKPCLMHDQGLLDLLSPLRSGAGLEDVIGLFEKAISCREPYWK